MVAGGVVAHERRTSDIAVVRLRPDQPYPYEPGQSLTVETDVRPRLWRTYSIANAPREDGLLELHVQAQDGGPVSGALVRHLAVGDLVRLGPPLGLMVLDPASDRDLLLVGGGTGLAPLKALVERVTEDDVPRRADMFVGVRTSRHLYDLDDLRRLEERNTWLTVTPVVADGDFDGETGLVGDVVLSRGPWTSRDVYVSGSPSMVRSTVDRLVQARVPRQRIKVEEFGPSRPSPVSEGERTR